ncbi:MULTISPECIES: hypothetical protein [Acidiplasma]|jgi:tRNA-intron endonuclease|uniref:tRNA intron endonuclease catalytic domain-containing protein n=3 Tax=Acidiplasma TaxID=507753 RepID=A0A0Q0RW50_9ARCH|nr:MULTISPECIES: hypothetical protein [Acidiplasma]KJE48901.1 hypothetical protein TZ01_06390 [Acidiplasma sp. MBA-1]KQB33967.1 hypothetical protein AOG54_01515 [Acidiplasma aeolicum]KQB34119.1 hypothetical protein AOG55_01375 [Acidiplasma cupricumulans]WMT54309.1 MAG: hypothetical protein RE470_05175 [Acidiplasma sp.]
MGIFCGKFEFKLRNISISQIINKYHIGKFLNGDFFLDPCEALYLFLKGKIESLNGNDLDFFLNNIFTDDIYIYIVYEILKNKGFYIKRNGNKFYYKKTKKSDYTNFVILKRETDIVSFEELYNETPGIFITLDEDHSITYHMTEHIDPMGMAENMPEKICIKNAGSIYYSLNTPEWFGEKFYSLNILNNFERRFVENKIMTPEEKLYADLIKRNFIVKSGFKYGEHFRIYSESMDMHAEYLIGLIDKEEWYKISRAVRLSVSVRKSMVFAGFINNEIKYIEMKRIKDI